MTRQRPADIERTVAASRLPLRVQDRIRAVVEHSGLRGNEQIDVVEELLTHFHDGIASGRTADELLDSFGDEHFAGRLIAKTKRGYAGPMRHVARLRRRGDSMLVTLRRNVRYAFKRLIQSPGFTATALLSLALGPYVIRRLRQLQVGQVTREEGPAHHASKRGTPTMGGLLIVTAVVVPPSRSP